MDNLPSPLNNNNLKRQLAKMQKTFNPGRFQARLETIFTKGLANEEGNNSPNKILSHSERKEMKNYIQKTWKELRILTEEQNRNSDISKILPSNYTVPLKEVIKKRTKSKDIEESINKQNQSQSKHGNNFLGPSDKINSNPLEDLIKQTDQRRKGRKEVIKILKQKEKLRLHKDEEIDNEWIKKKNDMELIEKKCKHI